MEQAPILYLVVPCYNEQEVLAETTSRLKAKLAALISAGTVAKDSRILYIDDGSKDSTWRMIEDFHEEDRMVCGVKLSRNRGHQNALLAGLMHARTLCDITISLDADLQDDIEAIDEFIAKYKQGADIVYGVRNDRATDTGFKRGSAQSFYKILNFFGVEAVYNHADYRLMSRRALDALSEFGEINLFLRGIVPQIGFQTATVEYRRGERFAGESKYPLGKMLSLATDGITSFSIKPIRMISIAGLIIFLASLVMLVYSLIVNAMGNTITGWTSIMTSVWLLGGLQILAIGIIGEYVGKSYMETKRRPRFIIEKILK